MLTWTETKLQPLDRGGNPGLRLTARHGEQFIGGIIWFPGRMWRVTWGAMAISLGDFPTRASAEDALKMKAGHWRSK